MSRQWFEKSKTFLTDAGNLTQETNLLQHHPGWPDMEQIIKAMPSIRYLEGEEAMLGKQLTMISEWSRKWGMAAQDMYNRYLELVRRSIGMEMRKVVLLDEWSQIHSERSTILAARLELGEIPLYAWQGVVQIERTLNDGTRKDLNRFEIDPLGLYRRRQLE